MSSMIFEEKNNTAIIGITGEITLSTTSDLDEACRGFINSGLKVIAFDLRYVTLIDSFGISRIIKHSKAFSAKGTEFVLVNMNDNIREIFRIATFDSFFNIMTKAEFTEKYINE